MKYKNDKLRNYLDSQLELMETNDDFYQTTERLFREISEENKNKTYTEILPAFFSRKKSVIAQDFHYYLDKVFELLPMLLEIESISEYINAKIINVSREAYVQSIMIGVEHRRYTVSRMFFSNINIIVYDMLHFNKEGIISNDEYEIYLELNNYDNLVKQAYDNYLSYNMVREGGYKDRDYEKDGYPSTSRGVLCYLFKPVKNLSTFSGTKEIKLDYRGKKMLVEIDSIKNCGNFKIYKVIKNKTEILYLVDYDIVAENYQELHNVNKEIYAGWWNKTLTIN